MNENKEVYDKAAFDAIFDNPQPLNDPEDLKRRRARNRAAIQQELENPKPKLSEEEAQRQVDEINALFGNYDD